MKIIKFKISISKEINARANELHVTEKLLTEGILVSLSIKANFIEM